MAAMDGELNWSVSFRKNQIRRGPRLFGNLGD
ncbi:hypothetical protein V475_20665 [Sphingobium baderi LL03]|uniref:Uncharacterized protein n=1 Tax=Sphingobium baderi LL03 TaxID=1114964 RepID=T0GYZ7_9SPHN|nr:hypothetical protein L485_03350 [Sphingobium baderi LL03]KMS59052.1 hypothetical protein V475_20665 [Sphingobium baderi LL03]